MYHIFLLERDYSLFLFLFLVCTTATVAVVGVALAALSCSICFSFRIVANDFSVLPISINS
jgi:hypothetical protein